MTRILIAFAFACFIPLLVGCAATAPAAPQVEYKTKVIDTSCQTFKLIVVPKADAEKISGDFAGQVLAHDRAWTQHCASAAGAMAPK